MDAAQSRDPLVRLLLSRGHPDAEKPGEVLELIRNVWIHDEAFAASRLSMMRIMTGRMNAATVVANRSKSRGIAKLLQLL
jgi:hypothetical protein